MGRKQNMFGALFHEKDGMEFRAYSESTNQRAKNLRSEIAKQPNIISITPIVKPGEELPSQFRLIIKKVNGDG